MVTRLSIVEATMVKLEFFERSDDRFDGQEGERP